MDFFFDLPSTSQSTPNSSGHEESKMCKTDKIDFFFDLPSTSQSTPNSSGHKESQMTEDPESPRGKCSNMSVSETEEQHTSSDIENISRRVQDLIEKTNDSRTSDQKVMDSFQEKLIEKVTEVCQQMKEHMYTVYEENSNNMQVKLQELTEVLERCTKLNMELMEANQALASLRTGLAISQLSEP